MGDAFLGELEVKMSTLCRHATHRTLRSPPMPWRQGARPGCKGDSVSPTVHRCEWMGSGNGPVVMQLMPGSVVMVLGDAVNLGFRISAIAGREGLPRHSRALRQSVRPLMFPSRSATART